MCVLHIYTIMNCDDMSPEKQEQSIATEIETLGTLHIHIHYYNSSMCVSINYRFLHCQ